MFARISMIRFDPARLEKAHKMWLNVSAPKVLR